MKKTVALIAGEGTLPVEICRGLSNSISLPVVYSFRSDNSRFEEMGVEVRPLKEPDFSGLIKEMKIRDMDSVIFAGNVPKKLIYHPEKLDQVGKKMLSSLETRDDHSLLGKIVDTFESFGIKVIPYRDLVPHLIATSGLIAGREPSPEELDDIEYGRRILSTLLPLSFGQTVVVAERSVVAVEAMEGTDETLKRAGTIFRGGVVVKMMKADQDERFDLPTVGPETLHNMAGSGLTCLAVEAGRTVILSKERFSELASGYDISVTGL